MEVPRVPTAPEVRSTDDIRLAYETLLFLEGVPAERASTYDLRSLAANLCDFQHRFSVPMPLPFGLGMDFPNKLVTPRPFAFLQRLGIVVPVDKAPEDPNKHDFVLSAEGVPHIFVGSKFWAALQGADNPKEHGLKLFAFRWLKDLFEVLAAESSRPDARRLAACWYYTASEASFNEDSESVELDSVEEDDTAVAVTQGLLGALGGGELLPDDDDDENDADFVPHSESFTSDTGEGDDEEDEEDEEGEQMQTSPEFKVPGNPVRRASTGGAMDVSPGNAAGQEGGNDDDDDDEDDDADAEVAEEDPAAAAAAQQKEAEAAAAEREVCRACVRAVERLGAYMPSPKTHMTWFKRMLIKMQPNGSAQTQPDWFPWGVPPVQRILDDVLRIEGGGSKKLSAEEDAASDFLRELLQPFMAMQQQGGQ